ncbi:MAG TPA: GDYXXLXY domain-containing protein [Spirochaetota bacterium]|nr:GDYXXLXY domain-containing protein [Spirochaetota bacterium]
MKKKIYLAAFCFLCFFQIGILVFMVSKGVKQGNSLYFKCSLYDPYDPIKGRYLSLSFPAQTLPLYSFSEFNLDSSDDYEKKYEDADIYIVYNSPKNTSSPSYISTQKPDDEDYFIKAKIDRINRNSYEIYVNYTFDKYYIQEDMAILAENIMQDFENIDKINPTLVVSVDKDGNSRILNLTVYDLPIERYITKEKKKVKKEK